MITIDDLIALGYVDLVDFLNADLEKDSCALPKNHLHKLRDGSLVTTSFLVIYLGKSITHFKQAISCSLSRDYLLRDYNLSYDVAFIEAARLGRKDIIQYMKELGNVLPVDVLLSALQQSIKNEHPEITQYLIEHYCGNKYSTFFKVEPPSQEMAFLINNELSSSYGLDRINVIKALWIACKLKFFEHLDLLMAIDFDKSNSNKIKTLLLLDYMLLPEERAAILQKWIGLIISSSKTDKMELLQCALRYAMKHHDLIGVERTKAELRITTAELFLTAVNAGFVTLFNSLLQDPAIKNNTVLLKQALTQSILNAQPEIVRQLLDIKQRGLGVVQPKMDDIQTLIAGHLLIDGDYTESLVDTLESLLPSSMTVLSRLSKDDVLKFKAIFIGTIVHNHFKLFKQILPFIERTIMPYSSSSLIDLLEKAVIRAATENRPEMLALLLKKQTVDRKIGYIKDAFIIATEKGNLAIIDQLLALYPIKFVQILSLANRLYNYTTDDSCFSDVLQTAVKNSYFEIANRLIQNIFENNKKEYSVCIKKLSDILEYTYSKFPLNPVSRFLLSIPEIFLRATTIGSRLAGSKFIELFINEKMAEFSQRSRENALNETEAKLCVCILQDLYTQQHCVQHGEAIRSLIRLPIIRTFLPEGHSHFSEEIFSKIDVQQDINTNDSNEIIYRLFFSSREKANAQLLLKEWVDYLITANPLRIDLLNIALNQAIKRSCSEILNIILNALAPLSASHLSDINWKENLCEAVRVGLMPIIESLLLMPALKNNTEACNAALLEASSCVRLPIVERLLQMRRMKIFRVVQPHVSANKAISSIINNAKNCDYSDEEFSIIEQLLKSASVKKQLDEKQLMSLFVGIIDRNHFDLFKQLIPFLETAYYSKGYGLQKLLSKTIERSDNLDMVNYILGRREFSIIPFIPAVFSKKEAFELAADRGYLAIVERLLQYSSIYRDETTLKNAIVKAAKKGHIAIVTRLHRQLELVCSYRVREVFKDALCSALGSFSQQALNDTIRFLLNYLDVFDYAAIHHHEHGEQIKSFIQEKLIAFSQRAENDALSDKEALTYHSYLVYIERNYQTLGNYYESQLHILAQLQQNPQIARLQAERQISIAANATSFQNDLRRIANDSESAMRALPADDQKRLKRVTERYLPSINEKGGINVAFEKMMQQFKTRYLNSPAFFQNSQGENITLPCEWEAFEALSLSKNNRKAALKAYYAHPLHTAIRYLSDKNPWMNPNAHYVINSNTDSRYKRADLGNAGFSYKPMIVVLWSMMSDINVSLIDDYTLDTRIDFFIGKLAEAGRTHNWDKTREKKDNKGKKIIKNGAVVREQFDNGEGDQPSCYSGARGYIFDAAKQGQALFRLLEIEHIKAELRDFAHAHFQSVITDETREALQSAWNSYIENPEITDTLSAFNIPAEKQQAFETELSEKYGEDFTAKFKDYSRERFVENKGCHAVTFGACLTELLPPPPDPDTGFKEIFDTLRQHKYKLCGRGVKRKQGIEAYTFSDGAARIYDCIKPLFDPSNTEGIDDQKRQKVKEDIQTILTEKTSNKFLFFNQTPLRSKTTQQLYETIQTNLVQRH